jgi:DNA-binding GntR family transcriptional regulator
MSGSDTAGKAKTSHLEVVPPTPAANNADPSGKAGKIAAEMERRLMLGEYHFGEPLSATQLARQFDASRQPVFAAIAHLRSSGYVEVIPQVGCRVVSPSPVEIGDFFVALGKIEGAAASFAARRYELAEEAETLVAISEANDPGELVSTAHRQGYINMLFDYHNQLWAMARSPALAGRVATMRRLAIFYLWQGSARLVPTSAHLLNMERAEVARAIQARDATRAEILMEKHVGHKPYVNGIL